ncbi:MAG: hypothetical protein FWG50_07165 [Kiritimatiellaeota bacterium]|nr:hypothetical protein [Kiritimatiellota bacterium]
MKRINGHVTWEVRFGGRFLEGIRSGAKRQTIRRGECVEAGDALRLCGPAGGTLMEVNAAEAEGILIRACEADDGSGGSVRTVFVRLGGKVLDEKGADAPARADGFGGVADMMAFMEDNELFMHGILDGQVIRW